MAADRASGAKQYSRVASLDRGSRTKYEDQRRDDHRRESVVSQLMGPDAI